MLTLPLLIASLSCGGDGGGGGAPIAPAPPQPPATPPSALPPEIGSPCAGLVVRGDPPRPVESLLGATLVLEWERATGGGFDWVEPYHDDEANPENRSQSPVLEVNVARWRVERAAEGVRHTVDIEWPPFREVGLRLRSDVGDCERPTLVCAASGCELGP